MRFRRLRLSSVLVAINLIVLTLPVGGIAALHLYESALVRQTESELIAQAAFTAASYKAIFARATRPLSSRSLSHPNPQFALPSDYGRPISFQNQTAQSDRWNPRSPILDLATDNIYSQPPEGLATQQRPDSISSYVGRQLVPILLDTKETTLAGFHVTDYRGTVVATTEQDNGLSLLNYDEVRRALAGEQISTMRWRAIRHPTHSTIGSISRNSVIRVFVAVPILENNRVIGAVLVVRTPANLLQTLYGKRREISIATALMLFAVVCIGLLTSFTISRPVRALREQALRAARGEKGAVTPLQNPGTREIEELSETVATMAQTLESRATYISDFAAHVSHEFKTPLTAIRGAVELLRDHGPQMSATDLERFLRILESDTERLDRLISRLLEMARADVMQVGTGISSDVSGVIEIVSTRHTERGLHVEYCAGPPLSAAISEETLDSILSSLLENVRLHAGTAVHAKIRCGEVHSDGRHFAEIIVEDNGSGISEANAARIFEPFFTTARNRGGTGLGLSIVRALLRAHGGDIELQRSIQGTAFRILVPTH